MLYAVGIALVAAAAVMVYLAFHEIKKHSDNISQNSSSASPVSANKACQIFTVADARTLLGADVKAGENPAGQSSPDMDVSTCAYRQSGSNNDLAGRKSATLLVRSPETAKGATSNDNEFGALKPVNVQDTQGFGEKAFWDVSKGELDILKNHVWYVLSYGPSTPASRTLDQASQMAGLLSPKL